jgi:hypothetical protein
VKTRAFATSSPRATQQESLTREVAHPQVFIWMGLQSVCSCFLELARPECETICGMSHPGRPNKISRNISSVNSRSALNCRPPPCNSLDISFLPLPDMLAVRQRLNERGVSDAHSGVSKHEYRHFTYHIPRYFPSQCNTVEQFGVCPHLFPFFI